MRGIPLRRQAERTLGHLQAAPVGALLIPAPRSLGEQIDGVGRDVVGHLRDRPELGAQFGCGGGVMGASIDLAGIDGRKVTRDAGVALRTRLLGERVVGHLAHDVAPETPQRTVEHQQPQRVEYREVVGVVVLPELTRELVKRCDRALVADDRCVVEHFALRRGQLVEAAPRSAPATNPAAGRRSRRRSLWRVVPTR